MKTLLFVLALFIIPSVISRRASAGTQFQSRIALHVKAHPTKGICTTLADTPCSQFVTYGGTGPRYDVYVVVANGIAESGIRGASFGVSYDGTPFSGLEVLTWRGCGDSEIPGQGWPGSGTGNSVIFGTCQQSTVPGFESEGAMAILGALYVYAYSPDSLEVVPSPEVVVIDCFLAESPLLDHQLGVARFSSSGTEPGCNPCLEPCAPPPPPPSPPLPGQTLYAADGSGGNLSNLYELDAITGQILRSVGDIGFSVPGLSFDAMNGTLYGTTSNRDPLHPRSLIVVDRATGVGTLVGTVGQLGVAADISFRGDGILHGWAEPNTDALITLDLGTGAGSLVGTGSGVGVDTYGSGLAFSPSGDLFFAGTGDSPGLFDGYGFLHQLDPVTGEVIRAIPMLGGSGDLDARFAALAFEAGGNLYGLRRLTLGQNPDETELVSIETTMGIISAIGTTLGQMDALAFVPTDQMIVFLDIQPTACPNPLNPQKQGVIPAAILGTGNFDVRDIDISTLLLEGVRPKGHSFDDVGSPFDGEPCACTEEGPDGFEDLTLKFMAPSILESLLPVFRGEERALSLTGTLSDGTPFEAVDCIIVVGGPKDAIASTPDNDPQVEDDPDYETETDTSGSVELFAGPNLERGVQSISYRLPERLRVTVTVYDVAGRVVRRLVQTEEGTGVHTVLWNTSGSPSGVYFVHLQAGQHTRTSKVLVIR